MAAVIIDGKKIAQDILDQLKKEVSTVSVKPKLVVVIVGQNPASEIYVNNKHKTAVEIGFLSDVIRLPESTSQEDLLTQVQKLNQDKMVSGILVQLPLPKQIDEKEILIAIDPAKDVDGFHPENLGKLVAGIDTQVPCTPLGCMKILETLSSDLAGKKAVVVGRSNIVGKPIALLLLAKNATVTICHSKTKNLGDEIKQADIVIAAVGQAKLITKEMIKPGAWVIDVGINRPVSKDSGQKICGDVDFDTVKEVAGAITPVPGGVGPLTIACLLLNTWNAHKLLWAK
jgi:methylenetetrahydrofolate dehydrogenase (NADP+)/methenyltetrahydrofolate cyclohydrolase